MYIYKLEPLLKSLIWGGTRLIEEWGMQTQLPNIAEDWAMSCHEQGKSVISNGVDAGKTLEEVLTNADVHLLGSNANKFPYFPILVKLIDAHDDLSVQVHPANDYALANEGEYGKTELWYVIDCEEGAQLVYGLKEKISHTAFQSAIETNDLLSVLNTVKVKKGDVFFIEAGTVHAIGKGVLIAEIQQNSNTTYRVYDYERVGVDGKQRELHVKKAVAVSKAEPATYPVAPIGPVEEHDGYEEVLLSSCEFFTVTKYDVAQFVTLYTDCTSFHHVLIVDGTGSINELVFKKGDSFFVPAKFGQYVIAGKCTALVTTI